MIRFNAPCIAFDSFSDYVETVIRVRTQYQAIVSYELEIRFMKDRWVNELSMCGWRRLLRDGPAVLHATARSTPEQLQWACDANVYIVFALRAALVACMCELTRPSIDETRHMMRAMTDSMLGFPECCWGFHGSGVLRGLLTSSFHAFVIHNDVNLVSKHTWPAHKLALLMSTHARLGRDSHLTDLDGEVMQYILQLTLYNESMLHDSIQVD